MLRGKEGWKASALARQDRERGRTQGIEPPRGRSGDREARPGAGQDGTKGGRAWALARRQLREEKELGAELRDLVPVMEDSISEETAARIQASGLNPGLYRLFRAYPGLQDSDGDDTAAPAASMGSRGGGRGGGGGFGGSGGDIGGASGGGRGDRGGVSSLGAARAGDAEASSASSESSTGSAWSSAEKQGLDDESGRSSSGRAPSSFAGF